MPVFVGCRQEFVRVEKGIIREIIWVRGRLCDLEGIEREEREIYYGVELKMDYIESLILGFE